RLARRVHHRYARHNLLVAVDEVEEAVLRDQAEAGGEVVPRPLAPGVALPVRAANQVAGVREAERRLPVARRHHTGEVVVMRVGGCAFITRLPSFVSIEQSRAIGYYTGRRRQPCILRAMQL